MSKKMLIPIVELELGDNLYIQIKDVSFTPFEEGCTSALPEACSPDDPAECSWKNENTHLIIKRKKIDMTYTEILEFRKLGKQFRYKTLELEYPVDDGFVYEFYDKIIDQIEEDLNESRDA